LRSPSSLLFSSVSVPKHPEAELRKAGAIFECQHAWRDRFATHTTIDGNLITGQSQNSGYETVHRILEKIATAHTRAGTSPSNRARKLGAADQPRNVGLGHRLRTAPLSRKTIPPGKR
jgi:hypothetical protein